MINKDNCMLLGTIAKPYGAKGLLQIRNSGVPAGDVKDRGLVFIEVDGLPVPFFVESFQEKSTDTVILKIEGLDSESGAREFTGYPVYIMKEQLKHRLHKTSKIIHVSGYRVEDIHQGMLGEATQIYDIAQNPLLGVNYHGKEYLVPLQEEIVLDIDDTAQLIRINAPEGLFEL
jgi:16S rRNA processing protein RimM